MWFCTLPVHRPRSLFLSTLLLFFLHWCAGWIDLLRRPQQVFSHMDGQTGGEWSPPPPHHVTVDSAFIICPQALPCLSLPQLVKSYIFWFSQTHTKQARPAKSSMLLQDLKVLFVYRHSQTICSVHMQSWRCLFCCQIEQHRCWNRINMSTTIFINNN